MTDAVVGTRTRAPDWDVRTTGRHRYASDVVLPDMLHARIVRSPHPYARIRAVNTSPAVVLPGVVAAVTARDFPPGATYLHRGRPLSDRPPLADGVVRFVGQEVAAVAATSIDAAIAGADAIRVAYEPLPAPFTIDEALGWKHQPLHDRSGGEPNVSVRWAGAWGDPTAGRRNSRHEVTGTFWYPQVGQAPMETCVTVASWHAAEERLELWTSTQSPYFVIKEVAHVLGLAPEQVVCREVAVGGGFGVKSKIGEHEVIAARLAMVTGLPVRLALDREEEFATTKPRHGFRTTLVAGADEHGRLRYLDGDITVDNGAYNHHGSSVMRLGVMTLGSVYRPDGVRFDARLVDTSKQPGGQFRGFGVPQVSFAMESLVDDLAQSCGVDPIDFRIRNANVDGETTLCGAKLDTVGLVDCLEAVREHLRWDERKRERSPFRGVGVSVGMHGSGYYAYEDANRSEASIDVDEDGRVHVRFGGADPGTGQRIVIAQVAAHELGVPVDDVTVELMDSERTPFDMGSWSSRGTHMAAQAVRRAAQEMAGTLKELAQAKLGGGEVRLRDGKATTDRGEASLGDLVRSSEDAAGGLSVTADYVVPGTEMLSPDSDVANMSPSYAFAAHGVAVEVDPDTGEVKILDYVAAHDVGKAINPTQVEGQIIGGVVQGLGAALRESLVYEQGRVVNPSYLHYPLPRAGDVPPIRPVIVECPSPTGPYGAKSVGELSIVPVGAAVANAFRDATGIRPTELPLTPDRVMHLLRTERGRSRHFGIWRRPDRWWVAAMRWLYPRGLHAGLHRWGTKLARRTTPRAVERIDRPRSVSEAVPLLAAEGAAAIGGGTDLLPQREQHLAAPAALISISDIRELQGIEERPDGSLRIGAAVTLSTLATGCRESLPVIADTVETIASAQVRAAATVGGNLLQAKRCWFFRNGFDCYKRAGPTSPCYAVLGDHRFHHAVIGAHRCQAVTPSDLATTFAVLDAQVVIRGSRGERKLSIEELYTGPGETQLRDSELVVAVEILPEARARDAVFEKFALTRGDFAIASVALAGRVVDGRMEDPRVVFGGLAPTPWRARLMEGTLAAGPTSDSRVRAALDRELEAVAHPLPNNVWKLDLATGLFARAYRRMAAV